MSQPTQSQQETARKITDDYCKSIDTGISCGLEELIAAALHAEALAERHAGRIEGARAALACGLGHDQFDADGNSLLERDAARIVVDLEARDA